MNKSPVYFVTGAAGFVGRHVCKLLLDSGAEVSALIRHPDEDLIKAGVKLWYGDLWDADTLQQAISGAAVVIHCAGDARFGNGPHYHKSNVQLTEHLIQATQKHALHK